VAAGKIQFCGQLVDERMPIGWLEARCQHDPVGSQPETIVEDEAYVIIGVGCRVDLAL